MKKKAVQQKQGAIARFCSAQEKKARISLILAAAVVVTTFGSVCTAAILMNSDTTVVPDDIVELNAAEQYLPACKLNRPDHTLKGLLIRLPRQTHTHHISSSRHTTPHRHSIITASNKLLNIVFRVVFIY